MDRGRRKVIGKGNKRGNGSATPTLAPEVQALIGDQLRAMYEDLVNQPLPDRFAELLKELDETDAENKS